jgi:HlyD family secretion protein
VRSGKRAWWIVIAVVLVLTHVATWWIASTSRTAAQQAADAEEPEPSRIEVPVDVGTVVRTIPADCAIEPVYTTRVDLSVMGSEDSIPVVTGLPLGASGTSAKAGTVIAEVSSRPVIVLPGDVPGFRTMSVGTRGVDVKQLQRALARTGDYSGTADGAYGVSTGQAVERLYQRAGYPVARSDEDAQNTLAEAQETLAALPKDAGKAERARASRAVESAAGKAAATVPLGEVAFVPSLPARISTDALSVGQAPADLTVSAGKHAAICTVGAHSAAQVKRKQEVRIPALATDARLTVESIRRATDSGASNDDVANPAEATGAESADGESGGQGEGAQAEDIQAVVRLPTAVGKTAVGQTAGPGEIVVESGPTDSLIVPSTALRTDSAGSVHVQVASASAGKSEAPKSITVTVVFDADGNAAVESDELRKGDRVVLDTGR